MLTHNTTLHVHNVQMASTHFQNRLVWLLESQTIGLKKALKNWPLQHYNIRIVQLKNDLFYVMSSQSYFHGKNSIKIENKYFKGDKGWTNNKYFTIKKTSDDITSCTVA